MTEFDLIERIRARAPTRHDVILGIGDDAALLQVPVGMQLAVAMDTLNAGVHFPLDTAPADIGWKALAVNLSDLAAMGAEPAWCTLSLALPAADATWLDGFLDGFVDLAALHDVALVGGDTTRGPLSICVTVHGFVAPGRALRRSGARVGDDIWVSGTLGDAAGALALLLSPPADRTEISTRAPTSAGIDSASPARGLQERDLQAADAHACALLRPRLDRPTPRVAAGRALAGIAHSAIDISDGLLADLGHLCTASGVGAMVELDALPTSAALRDAFDADRRRALQATGGDDYELCFTTPAAAARAAIDRCAVDTATAMTRIGRIVPGTGVHACGSDGQPWQPAQRGHEHFRA